MVYCFSTETHWVHVHTHSRCSFGHFLTKEGIQKFLYLNIAAHSPVDPFLIQPYQKETEEREKKNKPWFTDWENWRTLQKGGVSYSGKVQLYRKTTAAVEQARFRFVSNATESLLIVNIYHVVPDDKAVLKRLGNLSNSTQRLTNTYIQHFKQNRWCSVLPQSTLWCNRAY